MLKLLCMFLIGTWASTFQCNVRVKLCVKSDQTEVVKLVFTNPATNLVGEIEKGAGGGLNRTDPNPPSLTYTNCGTCVLGAEECIDMGFIMNTAKLAPDWLPSAIASSSLVDSYAMDRLESELEKQMESLIAGNWNDTQTVRLSDVDVAKSDATVVTVGVSCVLLMLFAQL